jgi:hypothetical protein
MNHLEEIDMAGGLFIENDHDVKILTNCIRQHPSDTNLSLLRSIRLLDFQSYASEKRDSGPLLEPFVKTAISCKNLQEFHIKCRASYKIWKQSYLSTKTIQQLVLSCSLQKLQLSNLGLTDDHLQVIATELSSSTTKNSSSVLTELILNKNRNTDVGIQALIEKLMNKNSIIEKLEVYNNARPGAETSELLLKQLDKNHRIRYLSINSRYQDKAEIEFFLLLNRTGRRALLNPKTNPNDAIEILDAARDDLSMLLYFLRQNPSLCNFATKQQELNDDEIPISSSLPESFMEGTKLCETQDYVKDACSTPHKTQEMDDEEEKSKDESGGDDEMINLLESQKSLKDLDEDDACTTLHKTHDTCSTPHKAEKAGDDERKGNHRSRGAHDLLRRTGSIKNFANDIICRFFR